MLGYVTIGTNNISKARAFYGALLSELGMAELFDNDRLYFYGSAPQGPYVVVGGPYDKQTATVGNGMMVALNCHDNDRIDAMHAKALELGATDDGAPGERGSCSAHLLDCCAAEGRAALALLWCRGGWREGSVVT